MRAMNLMTVLAAGGVVTGVTGSAAALPATVDFESQPLGAMYGTPSGNVPGELIFTEDGVGVRIDSYTLGAFTGFNNATIGGFAAGSFSTRPATLNNVRLDFDLGGLGAVTGASFEYVDFGGSENLVVNGTTLELANFLAAPASVAGVNVSVSGTAAAGVVTLDGLLTGLAIGGQELGIDNVRFVPEPASLGLVLAGLGALAGRRRRE